jgi:IS5 family transposase
MHENLFSESSFRAELSNFGFAFNRMSEVIDFEMFRPALTAILDNESRKSNAGRKPFDYVLMFKILVLQDMYNLADERMEEAILDRRSFCQFLGIYDSSDVPDSRTIWHFKEQLGSEGARALFDLFGAEIKKAGFTAKKGSMVDASFTECPRQHFTKEDKERLGKGEIPPGWSKAKLAQKDLDAKWTKKGGSSYFGYKNHAMADSKHKIIRDYEVTSAEVHDSQEMEGLLPACGENSNKAVFGDSAFRSAKIEALIKAKGFRSRIHRKACRGRPLSDHAKSANKIKSRVRARIEHVFGRLKNFGSDFVRSIGIERAGRFIGLANLVYNMDRAAMLVKSKAACFRPGVCLKAA